MKKSRFSLMASHTAAWIGSTIFTMLHARAHDTPLRRFAVPVVVVLVLAASLTAWPVLLVGLGVSGLVVAKVSVSLRRSRALSTEVPDTENP